MTDQSNGSEDTSTGDSTSPAFPPDALQSNPVFDALAHPRRRYLGYCLLEDTRISLDELATKIAAYEQSVPPHAVTESERNQVYLDLYHSHIPKLSANKFISFDKQAETILAGDNADEFRTAVRAVGRALDSDQSNQEDTDTDDRPKTGLG
jgi:hypothetical protein